jgi:hypothetical protein
METEKTQKTEEEYLKDVLENADPELKQWARYNILGQKQKDGVPLNEDEARFLEQMNKAYDAVAQEQEQKRIEQEENEKMRRRVIEEYEKTKKATPDKVVSHRDQETFVGGDSIPKLLKFALLMKKAKKKGGKILVKITRQKNVFFEWTLKDINFVEFITKDEKGNVIPEITRVTKIDYNFEGAPIPVLFAVQGYYENWDFYDEFRKDITSEMMARIASRARHAGYLEGINQKEEDNRPNNWLNNLQPFVPLILIIGFLVMGWILYNMYADLTQMMNAVEAMKAASQSVVVQ